MKRVALAVALSLCAPNVYAKPDARGEAKTRYEAAQREYSAGEYDDAARDFARAYELVGDSGLLFNAAQSFRLAGKWAMAADLYRTLLDKVPQSASNRPEIEGRIVELDERVADEKRRAERAKQDAGKRSKREPKVEPGPEVRPDAAVETMPVAAHERPGRTLEVVGYTLCGVTGAFLATGIAMSVLSKQANDDVQHAASHNGVFTQGLHDEQSRGHVYDKVQIASYAIAGAAAIGAGVTLFLGMRADKRANERRAAIEGRRVSIHPSIGPGFLGLSGAF